MTITPNDCLVPPNNCPLSPRSRRRTRWHTSVVAAVCLGLAGGGFTIGMGWAIFVSIQPPVIVQNSSIVNPVVEVGSDLQFHIRYMPFVDRSCLGSVTREFYTSTNIGGRVLREKKRKAGPPPITIDGETEYVIDVELPSNMAPGDWEFQGETSYDCGYLWAMIKDFPRGVLNGGVLRFRTRIMPFKLIAKKPIDQK